MRVQFMAAVILGLTLSPAPVFGCTCAAPPREVKTASELAAVSGTVSNSDNPQLSAKVKVMLMSASQPLLAYTADAATSGSFAFNQVLPGEYWAIVTVDASVESKWSTRKARVEVVGDITHLSLELIAN